MHAGQSARPIETILITSPLEAEHVARIRAVGGPRVEVLYEPALLPPTRYIADHNGPPGFRRSAEGEVLWRKCLARATVLWDFPAGTPAEGGGLALAPGVRWVQTTSSGVGMKVSRLGLAESNLIVTTARGVHAEALAEFVAMVLLAHVKDLRRLQREQRLRRWERYCCGSLGGRTLTVVGAGAVGARINAVARAFGMRTISVANRPDASRLAALAADELMGPADLQRALAAADYVVLATPHTPDTERMIDAAAIAAMRRGVVLINIARGQVIDESALIGALRTGHIGFSALDVAEHEPLPASSPLWSMDNVLISPHSASTDPAENGKITDIFCHNLACYLDGRHGEMRNVLDKRRMY